MYSIVSCTIRRVYFTIVLTHMTKLTPYVLRLQPLMSINYTLLFNTITYTDFVVRVLLRYTRRLTTLNRFPSGFSSFSNLLDPITILGLLIAIGRCGIPGRLIAIGWWDMARFHMSRLSFPRTHWGS